MSTSSPARPAVRACPPAAAADSLATDRLCEFILSLSPPVRQVSILAENPLCRLAARTAVGRAICNQGCGIEPADGAQTHVCPFQMVMRRVAAPSASEIAVWVGRRFGSVRAMHEALDQLADAGFDETMILDHLPPNPVVPPDEFPCATDAAPVEPARQAAEAAQPAATQPEAGASLSDERFLQDVLEYLDQIYSLLATAGRPEVVCGRFLHALGGLVPYDEMAIYLREADGPDLVLAATVDHDQSIPEEWPKPQTCRLSRQHLGWQALDRRMALAETPRGVGPADPDSEDALSLALPFPRGEEGWGIWLLKRPNPARARRLGPNPLRLLRLLADALASRLDQMRRAAPPADPGESIKELLTLETARAIRMNHGLTVIELAVEPAATAAAHFEALTAAWQNELRPYDRLAAHRKPDPGWTLALPLPAAADPSICVQRLLTIFEDFMDEHGGLEESGARLGAGVSQLGIDATGPEELLAHSREAARQALAAGEPTAMRPYDETAPAVGPVPLIDNG